MRFTILLFIFCFTLAATPAEKKMRRNRASPDAPITSAAEVRDLDPDEAARRIPVKIRGVVTYVATAPAILFLQDDTGGICVIGPREKEMRLQVKVGTLVEVDGVTAAGRMTPYIAAKQKDPLRITVLGDGPLPTPQPVSLRQLGSTEFHGELVDVSGIIRSIRTENIAPNGATEALILTLASGPDRIEAAMLNWHAGTPLPNQYIGASVHVRGVFNSTTPERQPAAGMKLLIPAMKDIRIDQPGGPAFEMPVSSIAALRDADVDHPAPVRARIKGILTLPLPGKGMYVQAEDGGVWVDGAPGSLKAGDKLDVVGFPALRGAAVLLEDAVWRVMGREALPNAPLLTAEQALEPAVDAKLVKLEALVLEVSRLSEGPTMVLQSGDRVFLARMVDSAALPALRPESWVRLTGICLHNRMPDSSAGGPIPVTSASAHPGSCHLLLASPASVDVIRAPSWWTLQRVLAVCGGLALMALLALIWVIALRVRVARQTATIGSHLARETLYEERVRIARELHDSLEQDLLGISMQLNATEKLLVHPDRARDSLHLAAAMVRRSQAETHRAVWDLRDNRSNGDNLVPKLQEAVAGMTPAAGTQIKVHVIGQTYPLAAPMENHLFRVALESVTNALKHARATRIEVNLEFGEQALTLRVMDDGRGFDTEKAPPPSSGHFGLFGMKERAEKVGGKLTIASEGGKGSLICLVVPVAQV